MRIAIITILIVFNNGIFSVAEHFGFEVSDAPPAAYAFLIFGMILAIIQDIREIFRD